MPQTIIIPPEFLIGTATAAHQVEGGLDYQNDYGLFSRIPGGEFLEEAGDACQHYTRFREDLDLLADQHLKVYRFGVEWARIEPQPGKLDQAEIEHYRQMIEACRERDIVPVITLHHFTSPQWLISQGGWESPDTPRYFARYARLVAEQYGDLLIGKEGERSGYICTLNEVNTGALNATAHGSPEERVKKPAWLEACRLLDVAPERFRPWQFASSDAAVRTIVDSHTAAVKVIHEVNPDLRVGWTMASQDVVPLDPGNPVHVEEANRQQYLREDRFWEVLKRTPEYIGDFLGVQSYTHLRCDGSGILDPPEGARLVSLGYEFAPQALANCIRHTREVMGDIPQLLTEFGIGTDNDAERVEYLQLGLASVMQCRREGIKIEGLLAWSAFDNYEWERGFGPRFGLNGVDYFDQSRVPKASAQFWSKVAAERHFQLSDKAGLSPDGKNPARGTLDFAAHSFERVASAER